mgnify:CR=1 FL=1
MTTLKERTELKEGEPHPAAYSAKAWLSDYLSTGTNAPILKESLASCAIENNRLAEICSETLDRLLTGKPVSDRYLLGLAWFVRNNIEGKHE